MKYRLRFETAAQLDSFRQALKAEPESFGAVQNMAPASSGAALETIKPGSGAAVNSFEYVLPPGELEKRPELAETLIAEIPSVIWPSAEARAIERLRALKAQGLRAAVCENIGAVQMCRELGLECRGGYGLNILNSEALEQYRLLGLKDATLSFELGFPAMRRMRTARQAEEAGETPDDVIPIGFIGYGYLPLMKFRACPMKGPKGCGSCSGFNYLTDRTDTRFPLICRERQYSELLNHLPVYVADKGAPQLDFECLYFTIERPDAVPRIVRSYINFETPDFLRTAGLYQRKLL